jgi:hypothetical protein
MCPMTKRGAVTALGVVLLLGCGSRTPLYGGTGQAASGDDGGDAGQDGALDGPADGVIVDECPKAPTRATWSMSVAAGSDTTDPNYSPFAEVYAVAMAADGSMFTAGCGTPNTPGCWNAGPAGQGSCFLMKLDPSGTALWQTRFNDGPADPLATHLVADDQGGVTLGLEDDETTTLGSGQNITLPAGCVVERFDASGQTAFVHPVAGSDGTRVFTFGADHKGNSALIANCGLNGLCQGMTGSLVVRLDGMGNQTGARPIIAGDDTMSSMLGAAIAPDGTLLVAGYAKGMVDFGAGPQDLGDSSLLLVTYDPALNLQSSLVRPDVGYAIQVVALDDGSGFVLTGDLDTDGLDLGGGQLSHPGQKNGLFIAKLTTSLHHVYSHAYGDATTHASTALCADPDGTVTWGGVNGETTDFGNGIVVRGSIMSTNDDGFLARFGPDGTPQVAIGTATGIDGVGCPPGTNVLVGSVAQFPFDFGTGDMVPPGGYIVQRKRP